MPRQILLRRVRLNCLQEIIFVSSPSLPYVCSALCDFFPSAVKDGRKNVIFFSRSDMRLCIYLHMYSKADALRRRAGIILTAGVYHNSVICIISLVKARANFRETRAAGCVFRGVWHWQTQFEFMFLVYKVLARKLRCAKIRHYES